MGGPGGCELGTVGELTFTFIKAFPGLLKITTRSFCRPGENEGGDEGRTEGRKKKKKKLQ
jgi:hypothetical protein